MRKLIAFGIVAFVTLMAAQAWAGDGRPGCSDPCMMEPSDGTARYDQSVTETRDADKQEAIKAFAERRDASADAAPSVAPSTQ